MITVDGLTCRVGKRNLLEDVCARFEPGRLNMILGPNGAGKSTLIKAVCGQIRPASGTVRYGGRDLGGFSLAEMARMRAVLSQDTDLAFPLTVREVVGMGRYPHYSGRPARRDEEAVQGALDLFEVSSLAERNFLTLSGGEKQRVQFARVVAQIWHPGGPRYLLMDEPLTFLDAHFQFDFVRKLLGLLADPDLVAVAVVHDLNLASKFADHILLLDGGKVLAGGGPEAVLTRENIKAAYRLEPVFHAEKGSRYLFFE
jgi:iron complex transport system ATP-binding protein